MEQKRVVLKNNLHFLSTQTTSADLDISGDGKLSHTELERALIDLDINITASQANALVQFMG